MSSCGLEAGFGITAQPQQGGGKGQFDSACIWMALPLGQTVVELGGVLRLGQGLFVAGLAVQAACQPEPQDQGRPVGCVMGGPRPRGRAYLPREVICWARSERSFRVSQ
ncbi:hypothetical protein GCM10010449_06440 [Streptomyces rectiviolaceus]|uniref:Uncharacterized protein n=1 Tax=Streptomyces rectiviolaceus TaxID=332591 RepID=A0ABP6MBG3_9ACTN